jgi:PIN domain nuclease of toxin-antitoxin system
MMPAATAIALALSAITLIETIYLSEKGKVSAEAPNRLIAIIADPVAVFVDLPIDIRISKMVESVARNVVSDMPDRIIAATALHYGVPVISRDRKIRSSGLETIW